RRESGNLNISADCQCELSIAPHSAINFVKRVSWGQPQHLHGMRTKNGGPGSGTPHYSAAKSASQFAPMATNTTPPWPYYIPCARADRPLAPNDIQGIPDGIGRSRHPSQ